MCELDMELACLWCRRLDGMSCCVARLGKLKLSVALGTVEHTLEAFECARVTPFVQGVKVPGTLPLDIQFDSYLVGRYENFLGYRDLHLKRLSRFPDSILVTVTLDLGVSFAAIWFEQHYCRPLVNLMYADEPQQSVCLASVTQVGRARAACFDLLSSERSGDRAPNPSHCNIYIVLVSSYCAQSVPACNHVKPKAAASRSTRYL